MYGQDHGIRLVGWDATWCGCIMERLVEDIDTGWRKSLDTRLRLSQRCYRVVASNSEGMRREYMKRSIGVPVVRFHFLRDRGRRIMCGRKGRLCRDR